LWIFLLKWGDSYDGHGEMYYDYNHGPSYKQQDTYHEPVYGKSAVKHTGYQPEPVYKPTPTYNWYGKKMSAFFLKHWK